MQPLREESQYDRLGQVVSGRRFWSDGTPVVGQQFEYAFDDIGNRTSTGGRESADSTYTVILLNQYSQRTVAGKVDVFGIANPTADVTVNSVDADQHGEYFHRAVPVTNTSTAQYSAITVVSEYGATQTTTGGVFVAKSPEVFTHDDDGNLTQDGRWDYVWDGENRLAKMRSLSGSPAPERRIEFEYDWQGRRIRKKVFNDRDDGQGTELSDTVFLYDGWNLVAELNANSSNAKIRTYVWGDDLSGSMQGAGGLGGLLKVVNHGDSTQHFVAYDGNGNVMGLVQDSNGTISARYEYGPFAEPLRASGAQAGNPFRFSTKYCDDGSGLYYYGYRYYDPSTGRWLRREPLGEGGSANLCVFVNNAPLSFWDWNGLELEEMPRVWTPEDRVFVPYRDPRMNGSWRGPHRLTTDPRGTPCETIPGSNFPPEPTVSPGKGKPNLPEGPMGIPFPDLLDVKYDEFFKDAAISDGVKECEKQAAERKGSCGMCCEIVYYKIQRITNRDPLLQNDARYVMHLATLLDHPCVVLPLSSPGTSTCRGEIGADYCKMEKNSGFNRVCWQLNRLLPWTDHDTPFFEYRVVETQERHVVHIDMP